MRNLAWAPLVLCVSLTSCGQIQDLLGSKKKPSSSRDDEGGKSSKNAKGDQASSAGDVPDGTYSSDNGFRPAKHGFKFPNSSGEGKASTPIFTLRAAREMFGDEAICLGGGAGKQAAPPGKNGGGIRGEWLDLDEDGTPDLFIPEEEEAEEGEAPEQPDSDPQPVTPPPETAPLVPSGDCTPSASAQSWIQMVNDNANGGVCEGMAVASLLIHQRLLDPGVIQSGASSAWDLEKKDPTRELIGKYFAYQFTDPTDTTTREARKRMTPNDVLDELGRRLQAGPAEQVTLGFYQAGRGGHAVVPYAVEDKGAGKFWVRIYDNNAPGVSRYLEFDRNKNSWIYGMGAINPSESPDPWSGDANTYSLDFTSLAMRQTRAACPFCRNSDGHRQVWSPEAGDLLVTDASGQKLGWDKGTFVNSLPNAYEIMSRGALPGSRRAPPVYVVPSTGSYSITIDGNGETAKDDEIAIFGDGIAIVIDDLDIGKDQIDTLTLNADGRGFKYQPGDNEAPDIRIVVDGANADYVFSIDDLEAGAGEMLELSVDEATGRLRVFDSGGSGDRYDLDVIRYRGDDVDVFSNDDVELEAGDAAFIDFGAWSGRGDKLPILEDNDHDGSVDETDLQEDED